MGNGLHIHRVAYIVLGDDPQSQVVPVVRKVHRPIHMGIETKTSLQLVG